MSDFLITTVKDGVIPKNKGLQLREMLKIYEGKDIILTIERKTKNRTLNQNRYLWGVPVKMITLRLRELGWTIDGRPITESDVYLLLTTKFLKRTMINMETGETQDTYLGSSVLTTVEFMDFIDNILRWASEFLQLYILEPNEF